MIAQKIIPNTHLQHAFKNPISFVFVALKEKERKLQPVIKALILPAILIDIVTLPIQIVGEYL